MSSLAQRPTRSTDRVEFGSFSLRDNGAALYRDEELVRLGSRALQILTVLTARAGDVVSKTDLIAEVWPDVTVAENNLTVHISALRQALGDRQDGMRYVVNVPGRGYCFVAPVRRVAGELAALEVPPRLAVISNLPGLLPRVVGLTKPVMDVVAKLEGSRLVTIVGPAGVGKTTLAVHVGQAEQSRYTGRVSLVELAALRDAEHIAPAIATAMRIELGPGDPSTTLLAVLSRTKALLVIDNCEHLIEAVAELAAWIGQQCPEVVILATSREPLRVGGEAVYSLSPLEVPPNAKTLTAEEALAYPAVQLFVEQIGAATNDFTLLDEDAAAAAMICRRLDGLPLAIQFASPLVPTFGISGLAARLDDRFRLMQTGLRGAPDRHRTLTTALDWSYGLLEEDEQHALRRLAIFVGGFTLEAAAAVVDVESTGDLGNLLARLYAKSLITRYTSTTSVRFRLLETTHAYALDKLRQHGEFKQLSLSHAKYFAEMLAAAWRNKGPLFDQGGYASLSDQLGNVRAALDWAFSTKGDTSLAVSLAAGAGIYFGELGLMSEARDWTRRALRNISDAQRNTHEEMLLQYGLAYAIVISVGNTDEATQAINRTIELATRLEDHDLQMRVYSGYHMYISRTGDNKAAMKVALRAAAVASAANDSDSIGVADALLARSYYYAGDQKNAQACVHSAFSRLPLDRPVNTIRFGNDPRIRALACEASILWFTGRADQARACVFLLQQCAAYLDDPVTAVQGSYAASLIALQCGDLEWATDLIGQLKEDALEYAIMPFPSLAVALEAELAFRKAKSVRRESLAFMRASFAAVRASRYNPAFHGIAMIEGLTQTGQFEEATNLVEELTNEMSQKGQMLFMPEYLRLRGDILVAQRSGGVLAEQAYRQAYDLAREQSALAWELRVATSLARLGEASNSNPALSLLKSVYSRFEEGFETADLVAARRILDQDDSSPA